MEVRGIGVERVCIFLELCGTVCERKYIIEFNSVIVLLVKNSCSQKRMFIDS
jgi:hypothetical protein